MSQLTPITGTVDVSGKADKVAGAVAGNVAALDGDGNLANTGHMLATDPEASTIAVRNGFGKVYAVGFVGDGSELTGITAGQVGADADGAAAAVADATATVLAGKSDVGHTHDAADVVSGTFGVTRIGTGTPAAGTYVDGGTGAWTALPASPMPTLAGVLAAGNTDGGAGATFAGDVSIRSLQVTAPFGVQQITYGFGHFWNLSSYRQSSGGYFGWTADIVAQAALDVGFRRSGSHQATLDDGAGGAADLTVTGNLMSGTGASGTFTTPDGKTVTVVGGVITSIV